MADVHHNFPEKVEDAVATFLASALPAYSNTLTTPLVTAHSGATIKRGMGFDDTEPPFISVAMPSGTQAVEVSPGSYLIEILVAVCTSKKSNASLTLAQDRVNHGRFAGAVADLFYDSGIIGYLNTAAAGTVTFQRIEPGRKVTRGVDGSMRQTVLSLTFRINPV